MIEHVWEDNAAYGHASPAVLFIQEHRLAREQLHQADRWAASRGYKWCAGPATLLAPSGQFRRQVCLGRLAKASLQDFEDGLRECLAAFEMQVCTLHDADPAQAGNLIGRERCPSVVQILHGKEEAKARWLMASPVGRKLVRLPSFAPSCSRRRRRRDSPKISRANSKSCEDEGVLAKLGRIVPTWSAAMFPTRARARTSRRKR